MNQKHLLQIIVGTLVVTIIGTIAVLIPYLVSQRELSNQAVVPTDADPTQAWNTGQSAESVCVANNPVKIQVSFTNKEPNGENNWMDVTVKDLQTDVTIDLGTIKPGETKTGTINTNRTSINDGQVRFSLKWTNRSGTDSRTANYSALTCQTAPSPTPTSQPSPTPPPPTSTPIPTSTPQPSATPMPPTSTPQPSATPTNAPSSTPRPSQVPSATPTETPSNCRLTIVPKTVTTSPTPTPTLPPGTTPTPTPPYYCNSPCNTDDQCRQAHPDYTCYSADLRCRHINAPQRDDCTVPTPGPSQTPTPPSGPTSTPGGPTSTPGGPTVNPSATPTPLIIAEKPVLPGVGTTLPTIALGAAGFILLLGALLLLI